MITLAELFDLSTLPPELAPLFAPDRPWEVLARLDGFGRELKGGLAGRVHPTAILEGEVFVAEGARVGPYALVEGPAWIGPGANVGHGAYLRGPVVLMAGALVGHSSEVKRSLLLPGARAPHFNYVGDSVIGAGANLGAGVKVANFKTFGDGIRMDGVDTGLRKLGAFVGDRVAIGCNAVLSPGSIIGPGTIVYNGALVRGTVPPNAILKSRLEHELASRTPLPRQA